MRKVVIGTGLGLAAVAAVPGNAAIRAVGEPAGVSAAGKLGLAPAADNADLVIFKLGTVQNKADDNQQKIKLENRVKVETQHKGNAADGSVIKGQDQAKLKVTGDGSVIKF